MIEVRTEVDIRSLKPAMRDLASIGDIPLPEGSVVSVKLDGEFSLIAYEESQGAAIINAWGKLRKGYPALGDFEGLCRAKGYRSLKVLAEPHLVVDGKMKKLPDFLHAMKSGDPKLLELIRLGVWDLVEVDGTKPVQPYAWRLQELGNTLNGSERVFVVPHIVSPTREGFDAFWAEWVVEKHYEGVVVAVNEERYRLKPVRNIEAVIVGLNKKAKLLEGEATSVRIALMDGEGDFVEVGDLGTATDREMSRTLYKLMKHMAQEEAKTFYVRPIVVVELEFTATYEAVQAKLRWNGERYVRVGTVNFFSLREPRLTRFRSDKRPIPSDVPIEQLA